MTGRPLLGVAVTLALGACGPSYTSADTISNTMAARWEARNAELCAIDDAGTCTPSQVRARSTLSFCANARELVVHRAPVPDAGVMAACRPQ